MTDTKRAITQRLSALIGLDVSAVNHAVDMLTIQFGPQTPFTTGRGTVLEGGAWALHVQCNWQLLRGNTIVATQALLADDDAHRGAEWLETLLVTDGPMIVKSLTATESGGFQLSMSNDFFLDVIPGNEPDDEDWRFFSPHSDAKHFIITGGKVDPWCLS